MMHRGSALRGALALALMFGVAVPFGTASGQGVSASGMIQQTFVAQFEGGSPNRQVTISGFSRTSAFAHEFVPETPVQGQEAISFGCVELRRGASLKLRDTACGEFTMYADPTLSSGFFAGQLPTDEGATITVAVVFSSTEPPGTPAPFVNPPPFFNANVSISRFGVAVGTMSTDAGEGFSEPVQSSSAGMGETLAAQANVFV